jgi:hypothetical protein
MTILGSDQPADTQFDYLGRNGTGEIGMLGFSA